jgi:hypothetical protein
MRNRPHGKFTTYYFTTATVNLPVSIDLKLSATATYRDLFAQVEHLAFRGTSMYDTFEVVRFLETIGARFGACQVHFPILLHLHAPQAVSVRGEDEGGRLSSYRAGAIVRYIRPMSLRRSAEVSSSIPTEQSAATPLRRTPTPRSTRRSTTSTCPSTPRACSTRR